MKNSVIIKQVLFLVTTLFISVSTAATMEGPLSNSSIATLALGPTWNNYTQTETLYLAPETIKCYIADNSNQTLVQGEFFLGVQSKVTSLLQGQIGLALALTSNATISGHIWDDADSQFSNYTYQYKVQNSRVALKAKLLGDIEYPVIPWISSSLGIGFNRTSDFVNTPTIFEAIASNNYAAHTQTAFSYALGIGLQKAWSAHSQIGISYEFCDWGKNALGSALGQVSNNHLGLHHFYTNGILLNITYLA